ncbi:RNA-directed DNA polymerase, eukaryota, partial [Tanacetum coccineum]
MDHKPTIGLGPLIRLTDSSSQSWNGDVIIMGDFNEVRTQDERHGSIFNAHGADAFNLFISSAGLEELPLDGCKLTRCHKSGSKMSKLDRFLISR